MEEESLLTVGNGCVSLDQRKEFNTKLVHGVTYHTLNKTTWLPCGGPTCGAPPRYCGGPAAAGCLPPGSWLPGKTKLGSCQAGDQNTGRRQLQCQGAQWPPEETEGLQKSPGTALVTCLPDTPPRDGSWTAWVTCWPGADILTWLKPHGHETQWCSQNVLRFMRGLLLRGSFSTEDKCWLCLRVVASPSPCLLGMTGPFSLFLV